MDTWECCHLLAIIKNLVMYIGVQISIQVPVFNSFRYIPRSGNARSYSNSTVNLLRTCHTIFHSSCIILYSHQQCTRVPICLHLHQYCYYHYFYNSHPMGVKSICHLKLHDFLLICINTTK